MVFYHIALLPFLKVRSTSGENVSYDSSLNIVNAYAKRIATTQTDMYDFKIEVHSTVKDDPQILIDCIIPLMQYLDGAGEGGAGRASQWNELFGIATIIFVNDAAAHLLTFLTEYEMQINSKAYTQMIQSTGKTFIETLLAETIYFTDDSVKTKKINLMKDKAVRFWAEDHFSVNPLSLDRSIMLANAIELNIRRKPWKTTVGGTDVVLWESDPTDSAHGSDYVEYVSLAQKESTHFHNLLKPVLSELFSNPHIAALHSRTKLRNIVLTKDLRDDTGDACLGITISPDSEIDVRGKPRWQTIFFNVDDFSTGAAYRTLFHEIMHTWANTFPTRFWRRWDKIQEDDDVYGFSIEGTKQIAENHRSAILGFPDHAGMVSPIGSEMATEDVPEYLRALTSEGGRELVRRHCGRGAAKYDPWSRGPDLVMRAKVRKLIRFIRSRISPELAGEIRQTVFRRRNLIRRTMQGQRIYLVQAEASMESYRACDKFAAELLRKGAIVTHMSPRMDIGVWPLETLLGPDPQGALRMEANSHLYIVGDTSQYVRTMEHLLESFWPAGDFSSRIYIMTAHQPNVQVFNQDLSVPENAGEIKKYIQDTIMGSGVSCKVV